MNSDGAAASMSEMRFTLVRLAVVRFFEEPRKWRAWEWIFNDVRVESRRIKTNDKRIVLVVAHVQLDGALEADSNGEIVVPEAPRQRAEAAIEAAANAIAVAEGCGRSIMSPLPCISFIPASPEARAWLSNTKGVATGVNVEFAMHTSLSPEIMSSLSDRVDGVTLLAETLSHSHGAGRFRESLRVFERAFTLSSTELVDPLSAFLEPAGLGYTCNEVENWVVTLRHPATHADRRPELILESHVRHVLTRIQQAAYDVLFNKARWRTSDTARRELWMPDQWITADGELWIMERTAPTLRVQALDAFRSFPLNVNYHFRQLPDDWWFNVPETYTHAVPHTVTRIPLRQSHGDVPVPVELQN